MMELRFENGVPSDVWEITLPSMGHVVTGDIAIRLAAPEEAIVLASYKTIRKRVRVSAFEWRFFKVRVVVLEFSRVTDGWAELNVCERDKKMFEKPLAFIEPFGG